MNRDIKRRQTFLEKKSVCAVMPFFGLQGQDFTSKIRNVNENFYKGKYLASTLRIATETITNIEIQNQTLAS